MLRSLYAGVSGLRNHQVRMDVLGNNISNVNTTGFKASSTQFQDTLNQIVRGGGGGRNPIQVGTGSALAATGTKMEQGAPQMTGRTLDLCIQGNGFFKVSDGTNEYFTRNGVFFIDANNNLVTANGLKLQNDGGDMIFDASVSTLNIDKNGQITYYTVDDPNTANTGLSIQLFTFPNPEGLYKFGNNLYRADINSSGDATAHIPGEDGSGTVESGYLEMSNTDLSEEFTNMIVTQRGYQANARVITVSDTLLEELIQLKR